MSDINVREWVQLIPSGTPNGTSYSLTDAVFGGETPKAAIIFAIVNNTASAVASDGISVGVSVLAETEEALPVVTGMTDEGPGLTVSNTASIMSSYLVERNFYVYGVDGAGLVGRGTVALQANGVLITVVHNVNTAAPIKLYIIAFGGNGIRKARTSWLAAASVGTETLETPNIKPNFIFAHASDNHQTTGKRDGASLSYGVWGLHHGTTETYGCVGFSAADNEADSIIQTVVSDNSLIKLPSHSALATDTIRVTVDDVRVGEVDFGIQASPGASLVGVLMIEFLNPANIHISHDSLTTVGVAFTSSAHTQAPVGVFGFSADTGGAALNSYGSNDACGSLNWFQYDTTNQAGFGVATDGLDASPNPYTAPYSGYGILDNDGTGADCHGTASIVGNALHVATWTGSLPANPIRMVTVMFSEGHGSPIRYGTTEIIDVRYGADPVWWDF